MSSLQKLIDAALQLADLGIPVFPVHANKTPACMQGFKAASTERNRVMSLFVSCDGPLIGVPTGAISGIDVFDIDSPRHPQAADWYEQHKHLMPITLTHQSISGGLHLIFKHKAGLRCSTRNPNIGIDIRADGGYIIWWPAVGCPILNDSAPATWPTWLLNIVKPPKPTPDITRFPSSVAQIQAGSRYAAAALQLAAEKVAMAPTGQRNDTLNREMYSLLRFVSSGELETQEIADVLARAAISAGLDRIEVTRTITSALRARGVK